MSQERPFHIAKALEFGWDVLSRRWMPLVIWAVVLLTPHLMVNVAMGIFSYFASDHKPPAILQFINLAVQLITFLLYTRVVLLCIDDEPAGLGDVLTAFKYIIPFGVSGFIFSLLLFPAFLLLIVPGIYLMISLGFYSFYVLDQDMGPIAALKRSWAITRGHMKDLTFFYFVLCMVVFGGLICFMVGVIPASIVSSVAMARVYRQLDRAYDGEDEEEDDTAHHDEANPHDEGMAG
jgi:hypothetical protein